MGTRADAEDAESSGRLDTSEFARRYEEAARTLWCIAAAIVPDRAIAEDVLQEAAMVALEKLDAFDPDTNFIAWMGQIVRYTALNHARRAARSRVAPVDPAVMNHTTSAREHRTAARPLTGRGDLAIDQESFDDEVVAALMSLEETARACLLMKTVMDLPYREIAASLSIPEGTAMSHVHRARAALRERLDPGEETEDEQLVTERRDHLDEAIDAALRRRLAPPDQETLSRIVRDAIARKDETPPRAAGVITPRRRLAVAAALIGAIVGAWLLWVSFRPHHDPYAQPWRSLATVYADTTRDFEPQWVCRDDEEFAASFVKELGQPLLLAQGDGIEALGLSVSNTISRHTLVLLARVHGDEVLVFVDRVEPDHGQEVDPESGLRLFDRRIGDLVLYELTPREQPDVLELFYQPEAP